MSIWVYSETSRLAGGMSTLLNELRPSVDTVKNAMAELQGNIGDGSALSGQAYSKISDTITNYLSPIADGFDKLESNVSSSLSIYRRSGAVLDQEVKKIDSAKLEQAIQTEIMIQRAGEALMATTLAGAIPMVRDYVESHADKVKELRKHLEAYSTYKSSVSHLFDDDLVALNALTTALNDISNSTLNPDGSISFPGNKVPSWPKTLSAYSASAGQSYKQQLQSTFALDGQTAADVDALQKGLKKKFPDKSNEELAYMTMLLISKAQYAGPLWKQTLFQFPRRCWNTKKVRRKGP